jgi:hypothetical protein
MRRARSAIALALAAGLLGLLLIAARSAAPDPARAQVSCPALPVGFSPDGPGPTRFTMMIRINTQGNVDTYAKPENGMGDRLRVQDIFVINTRFGGSGQFPAVTPAVASQLAANLRTAFPCNRIIALNGMSFDSTAPGYAFTGIDDPNFSTLLTDYEKSDWDAGRATDPARPAWLDNFKRAFPLIKGWNASVATTVAANPIGAGKRTGLAPQDEPTWDYGQIAQQLDKLNTRLGATHLGPLSVQTQDACADGSAAGFGARAKALRLQYTFRTTVKKIKVRGKNGKKRTKKVTTTRKLKPQGRPLMSNLAMEISFTDTPDATKSQAILSTSAAQAAACVPAGLKQKGGAFFFFASDDAMRLLFQQPQIATLRPPASSSSHTTGGVVPGGS